MTAPLLIAIKLPGELPDTVTVTVIRSVMVTVNSSVVTDTPRGALGLVVLKTSDAILLSKLVAAVVGVDVCTVYDVAVWPGSV